MQFSISLIILSVCVCLGAAQNQLFEDDFCKEVNDVEWTCKPLAKCKSALQSLKVQRPEMCGFVGSTVLVCCEPSSSELTTTKMPTTVRSTTSTTMRPLVVPPRRSNPPPNSSISVQKCYEYARSVFQEPQEKPLILEPDEEKDEKGRPLENTCGISEKALIVNGDPSSPREFPHQVNLGYTFSKTIKWLCTGSLISETFVLSAAHCSRTSYGAPTWAVTGDLDTESDSDIAQPQRMRIIQHFDHPKYHDIVYNDITLYRLERAVTFDAFTRPACLNNLRTIAEKQAIATGWGLIRSGGATSPHLQKVRLNLINKTKCSEFWSRGDPLKNGIEDETMICAGDLEGKKDTCSGDSGGPLQNAMETPYCMYNIIGVTSFGRKRCASGAPGVYTRISHYVPWIESVVWPQLPKKTLNKA